MAKIKRELIVQTLTGTSVIVLLIKTNDEKVNDEKIDEIVSNMITSMDGKLK